jgi:hypothetical protein
MSTKAFPLREFIASSDWKSALFTTFSLSLSFVEDVVTYQAASGMSCISRALFASPARPVVAA